MFTVLARKAGRFAPDDSLPAWLHKTALLESKSWLRGELRRRRREQTAAELGTTMNTPEDQPAFHALVPLLDEALLSLREKDRTALLLRFWESHSLRDVGATLGVGEDAARKLYPLWNPSPPSSLCSWRNTKTRKRNSLSATRGILRARWTG